MRAIDRKQYHSQTLEHLESLKKYDSMRTGYYTDLANKWSIENRLQDWIASVHSKEDIALDLSNLNLVNLHYEQYLCVANEINLCQNLFNSNVIVSITRSLNRCNALIVFDDLNNENTKD